MSDFVGKWVCFECGKESSDGYDWCWNCRTAREVSRRMFDEYRAKREDPRIRDPYWHPPEQPPIYVDDLGDSRHPLSAAFNNAQKRMLEIDNTPVFDRDKPKPWYKRPEAIDAFTVAIIAIIVFITTIAVVRWGWK